jgi:hypothetical protein
MPYQFGHVEAYARTAGKRKAGAHSLATIVAEAERQAGACPHIEDPKPPEILFGLTPSQAAVRAAAWAEASKDAKGQKLRKDGLCMAAGVITLPKAMEDRWEKYKKDCLRWLQRHYGRRLLSVVEHVDEANPHLHFFCVPLKGERFDVLHDGQRAAREVDPDRGNRSRSREESVLKRAAARAAYKTAMREWQDKLYNDVSKRYGLTRIGPKKRRLSRAGWKAEQEQLEALAAREAALEAKEARLVEMKSFNQDVLKSERAVMEQALARKEAELIQQSRQRDLEAEIRARDRIIKKLPPELVKAVKNALSTDRGLERG